MAAYDLKLVFCAKCGSPNVDVQIWKDGLVAIFTCSGCGHSFEVGGFTIGKCLRGDGEEEYLRRLEEEAARDAAYPGKRGVQHLGYWKRS